MFVCLFVLVVLLFCTASGSVPYEFTKEMKTLYSLSNVTIFK